MGSWTHIFGDSGATRTASDTYLDSVPNQIQWVLDINGDKIADNGRVYNKSGALIYAMDAHSGVILWTKTLSKLISNGCMTAVNGNLIIPSIDLKKMVLVSGDTGEVIRELGDRCWGVPLVEDNLYFNGSQVYDINSGEMLWENKDSKELLPQAYKFPGIQRGQNWGYPYLLSKGKIFFRNTLGELTIKDAKTGNTIARKNIQKELGSDFMVAKAFDGKVILHSEIREIPYSVKDRFSAGKVRFSLIDGNDGAILWQHEFEAPLAPTYRGHVFVTSNRVWISRWGKNIPIDPKTREIISKMENGLSPQADPQPGVWDGLDRKTGKILQTLTMPEIITWHCGMLNVSEKFWTGNRPGYYVRWETGKIEGRFGVVRVPCGSESANHFVAQGLFIAEGTLGCACIRTVTGGCFAFSADGKSWDGTGPLAKQEHPVLKGLGKVPEGPDAGAGDWPMPRADFSRSGSSLTNIPDQLNLQWTSKLTAWNSAKDSPIALAWEPSLKAHSNGAPGPLTQPVIANENVFVSIYGNKQVAALNAKTGKIVWTYNLPAQAGESPTYYKGLAITGCHDGWVYALNASNGELVWKTRIAPVERRIVACGKIESKWPVVSGVLVANDTVCAVAGRTTEADGGVFLIGLNPSTGEVLWQEQRKIELEGDVGRVDERVGGSGPPTILCSDGKLLASFKSKIDFGMFGSKPGEYKSFVTPKTRSWTNFPYHGLRRISTIESYIISFEKTVISIRGEHRVGGSLKPGYIEFREDKKKTKVDLSKEINPIALAGAKGRMVLAVEITPKTGASHFELQIRDTATGEIKSSLKLPSAPIVDGMSIANGRVYVAMEDSSVLCYGN